MPKCPKCHTVGTLLAHDRSMRTPTTLLEAVTYFSDPERAFEWAVKLRWPNGVACPRMGCGSASVQFIKTRKLWPCKGLQAAVHR